MWPLQPHLGRPDHQQQGYVHGESQALARSFWPRVMYWHVGFLPMLQSVVVLATVFAQSGCVCTKGRGPIIGKVVGGSDVPVDKPRCKEYNLQCTPLCQYGMYMQQGS